MCLSLVSERKINELYMSRNTTDDNPPSIGSFYAFILSKNENVTLSVIGRSNYEAVKRNGLQIESKTHGNHKVHIDHGTSVLFLGQYQE